MGQSITLANLNDFIRGAAILGTGGGGDPYLGRLMLQQELREVSGVELLPLSALPDDAFAVSVASMGAPTVFVEKVPNAEATVRAVREVEARLGRRIDAVIPLEAGGINATLPLVVAAQMGVPVVDADGMGRAFPELQMTSFNIKGVRLCPLVTADDHGNTVLYDTVDAAAGERLARAVCVRMGGIAQIALYPMTGREAKASATPGTVSMAIELGEAVVQARLRNLDRCEAVAEYFRGRSPSRFAAVLFDGKVVDVRRETKDGFTVGRLVLEGSGPSGERMEISFQNEFTMARCGGEVRAIVPDLICALDRETGEPVTTEALRYGQRLKILGVSADPIMRGPEAIAVVGPAAFGLSEPFEPIEALQPR